jgi:hypothetical protein
MQKVMEAVISNSGTALIDKLNKFTKEELIEFIEGMKELGGYDDDLPNIYRDYCNMVGNNDKGC